MRQRHSNVSFIIQEQPSKFRSRLRTFCTHGPLAAYNPTSSLLQDNTTGTPPSGDELTEKKQADVATGTFRRVLHFWTSRNNRKGRHELVFTSEQDLQASTFHDIPTTPAARARRGISRMFTTFPFGDVSYLSSWCGMVTGLLWTADGLIPIITGERQHDPAIVWALAILALLASILAFITIHLGWIEVINANKTPCFGWEIKYHYSDKLKRWTPRVVQMDCFRHHGNVRNLFGADYDCNHPGVWRLAPSWRAFRRHYSFSIGFWAALTALPCAYISPVTSLLRLPPIVDRLSSEAVIFCIYGPKILASASIAVAGYFIMLETQRNWWRAAPGTLGWHIGVLQLLCGLLFVAASALVICGMIQVETLAPTGYYSSLVTLFGGCAAVVASLIAVYESLEKHVVSVVPDWDGALEEDQHLDLDSKEEVEFKV